MGRRFGLIVGCAAALLAARVAHADDTHYRAIPIGAHAVGLGGAFAGVADDASAAYFNPGGLALGGTHGLAGGLSINAWERVDLRRAFDHPDAIATATTKTGRTVPLFIGAVLKFGPKDALDQKKFALALSVLEPIFGNLGTFFAFKEDDLVLTDTYKLNASDRATWYGLSFASRLNLKQSIGATLYLSVRKFNHAETGIALAGGTPIPDNEGGFVGTSTAVNTQSLSFRAFHLIMRFGWLCELKPQLQLGLMLQTPGIPLQQRVDTLSQGFANDASTIPLVTNAYYSDGRVEANLPIPGEFEAGLEYWPAEKVMLAFDASIHSPVKSSRRVETGVMVPVGGLFFDQDTARRFIGNVAIAGDFFFSKKVALEAGFFTDLSSAKDIPANPIRYQNPQINRMGGTLSVAINVAGVGLSVGSTYIYGKGDAVGVVVNSANEGLGYTRTEATSRTVYLHLTGATQAAADLGDKTARGIKKRMAEKQAEEEAEEQERLEQEAAEAEAEEQERLEQEAAEAEAKAETEEQGQEAPATTD